MKANGEVALALHRRGISVRYPEQHLGPMVRDEAHFIEFLKALKPEQRSKAYRKMRPYLRFRVKPYHKLGLPAEGVN